MRRRFKSYYKTPVGGWRVTRTDDTVWGNTRLVGTRLTVVSMAGRFAAGDSIQALAKDYDIDEGAIICCVRALCKAAFSSRGLWANVERKLEANAERGIP